MASWVDIFLLLPVGLVVAGALIGVWLVINRLCPGTQSRPDEADGDIDAPVVRHSYDVRDHGGPIVERRGPGVTESRIRDVIDHTSGENPRL